jgi:Predicted GTPases
MNASSANAERSGKPNQPTSQAIGDVIRKAIQCLGNLGPQFAQDRGKLEKLLPRLVEERFHLAVLGQFKRGKSSLINALLNEAVLPTAVIPLTAIPTFIRAGDVRKARVSFGDAKPEESIFAEGCEELAAFLAHFVSEAENPKNRLGVTQVEVFHPAALLRHGVVLIDTPGIGATFRHNTEATLIFLFNKADYLDENEKQCAMSFFRTVLEEEVGVNGLPVYCVSARRGLEAKRQEDAVKWEQSGLGRFERHLVDFLIHDKVETFNQALAQKTVTVLTDIEMQIEIMIQSLKMPIANLEQCREALDHNLADIEHQRIAAQDMLAGDQRREASTVLGGPQVASIVRPNSGMDRTPAATGDAARQAD